MKYPGLCKISYLPMTTAMIKIWMNPRQMTKSLWLRLMFAPPSTPVASDTPQENALRYLTSKDCVASRADAAQPCVSEWCQSGVRGYSDVRCETVTTEEIDRYSCAKKIR